MCSATRVFGYTNIPSEGKRYNEDIDEQLIMEGWPNMGEIVFKKVYMKPWNNSHFVLKNINFHVIHGEKIGILGTSGSGKSSIFTVLLRIFELDENLKG